MVGGLFPGGGYPGGDLTGDFTGGGGGGTTYPQALDATASASGSFLRTIGKLLGITSQSSAHVSATPSVHDSARFTVTDGTGSFVELAGLSLDDFTTVYIAAQVYLPAATETAWLGGAFTDSPMFMWARKSGGGLVDYLAYHDSDTDGFYDKYQDNDHGDFTGLTVGTWAQVEWQRDPTNTPGPLTVTVDGTLQATEAFPTSGTIASIRFGAAQQHNTAPASGEIYIARIRVGTTPGGTDVLDWDAELASDFTAFTSSTGTVDLALAPTPPPAWGDFDVTPPAVVSIIASGTTAVVTWDEAVMGATPSEWSVKINAVTGTVTAAADAGAETHLTFTPTAHPGDDVLVTYTG